jgi:hypothetical protein
MEVTVEMKTISIDIETFSSNDLAKCGVYKYAQAPDFEILLFGYAVDGGGVQVVDLASGEEIPEEILAALSDENVTKWAFNASFERVCLSEWLRWNHPEYFYSYSVPGDTVGMYLDPCGWKCSMVWSAYMGLPLSLEGVGAVLGLEEQKLKEGRDLIRYFCVPCKATKSNGGRTRNLPVHDWEKWERFKFYNKRDVEVEMAIQRKLQKFPVPDAVWHEYHLDQEINDRGILLDMDVVEHAIELDEITKVEIAGTMKAITGLDNPNSVVQMKGWLSEHGVEAESLGKKDVAKLITDVDGEVRDALILRQQLALGYGGSVGALKSMGALEMGLLEEELQPLVDSWRSANPNIVRFWWEFDRAVKQTVKKREDTEVKGIRFSCRSGMLFIELPSGRRLSYVKPRIGENRFGGESVTYEGVDGTKKWERIESYGPKFVENIVQAISRNILCYAMRTLSHCLICAHVHDELIIECREDVSLEAICEQMGRTPPWAKGLVLRADGYCTKFYKKD